MLKQYDKTLIKYRKRYELFTKVAYAQHNTKDSILFAFLSVNTAYEVNAKAWQAMRGKEWLDPQETMVELMKHGIHYASSRANYICQAFETLNNNPKAYDWNKDKETIQEYRSRLVKTIKGLSWIKVSFFLSLKYGAAADICCIDRWMLRALGHDNVDEAMRKIGRFGPLPRKRYEQFESELRAGARKLGLSLCAYQWGIWDIIQHKNKAETSFPIEPGFKSNPMRVLWNKQ
jgi:thermostable 8-oxoguanine DNA glycosylase